MHLLVPVKVEWRAMLPQLVLSPQQHRADRDAI